MANCESCKKVQNAPEMERKIKRLWIAVIVAVCLLFASNAAWLYAWCQYDYSGEETIYQQDGEGFLRSAVGEAADPRYAGHHAPG